MKVSQEVFSGNFIIKYQGENQEKEKMGGSRPEGHILGIRGWRIRAEER
jgi:hypothetical protein